MFFYYINILFFILLSISFNNPVYADSPLSGSKKMMIDLQNVSMQDALSFLGKTLNMNLVISPAIHGTASLHLKNVAPLDALDLLIMSHELIKQQVNHVLYIMPRNELMQIKQQELKLQEVIDDAEPLVTSLWQIHYAKAEDIANLLKGSNGAILSKRGRVHVDLRTNILCVQDISSHMQDIHKLIQRLDIPIQQVLIKVYLASVDNDYERELGINFVDQQADSSDTALSLKMGYGLAVIKLADGSLLHMQLSAMERAGHGELISSPSLFAANQQTASIESGEEIPYQEISRSGATGVVFKKAVLSLKVTPQVMPDNQILLQLQVNQDKPSNRIILGVPAITTRQMSTNILVKSGQTIVLGGIYESDKGQQKQGIPFLNKIPLVGLLFKQQNVTDNKRELLIFVTPKVIN